MCIRRNYRSKRRRKFLQDEFMEKNSTYMAKKEVRDEYLVEAVIHIFLGAGREF